MRFAASIVRRDAPRARPASIWISTGQTDPGRYLPSWLVKKTRAPAPHGMSTPRLRSTTSHGGKVRDTLSTPTRRLASIGQMPTLCSASAKEWRLL